MDKFSKETRKNMKDHSRSESIDLEELWDDIFSIDMFPEEIYESVVLSGPEILVMDDAKDRYLLFRERDKFWKYNDRIPSHLRCFSEVVNGDLPQIPDIHINSS
ncbi:hypothetical protein C1645_811075 [Glomus cerebriforme]|uniref:Uncharacterized protein n=1 Tax=Glomus cerebriforme TaxID=658196 RepID=A0A397TX23_9GLOM|nr:hypothetical protein C1645_811075 [Glomus cerebriforme]